MALPTLARCQSAGQRPCETLESLPGSRANWYARDGEDSLLWSEGQYRFRFYRPHKAHRVVLRGFICTWRKAEPSLPNGGSNPANYARLRQASTGICHCNHSFDCIFGLIHSCLIPLNLRVQGALQTLTTQDWIGMTSPEHSRYWTLRIQYSS